MVSPTLTAPRESERVVLVVEDEPILRASMARGLSKLSNIEVVVAGNVADARKLIVALQPRVLVVDLHLPDGLGLELLSEIDKIRAATIFVTAYPQRLEGKLPDRRAVRVLEKPVPIAELRAKVIESLDELGVRGPSSSPFCLADYMQLAGYSRRTVRIDLYRDGERLGGVWVMDGEGYHAEDARGTGEKALRRLLVAGEVTVECHAIHGPPKTARTLDRSCEELLLDSTRFFDEAARDGLEIEASVAPALAAIEAAMGVPGDAEEPCPKTPRSAAPETFEQLYARGVDALLSRSYADAYTAFVAARDLGSTTGLEANLNRLRAMGYGQ